MINDSKDKSLVIEAASHRRTPLRVCHVIIGLGRGGAELMLKRLIESFKASDTPPYQVVISITSLGRLGEQIQAEGIEVHELKMHSLLTALPAAWRLFKTFRLIKPDIIQTWMYHADLLGGVVGRLAGFKRIIWGIRTTDINTFASKKTKLVRWCCAKLSNRIPSVIVCVAEKSRDEHIRIGYSAKKMIVIPNGFHLDSFHADNADVSVLKIACGFHKDNLIVGNVGRFNAAKDPLNFIQAASLVVEKMPHVRFLMVGKNCNDTNHELYQWLQTNNLQEYFVLLDEREDIPVCLAAMDVFCMASVTEGFPNALGEAMVMKKACVATDVGGAAYLLGECGYIVPSKNPFELAEGMMKLLKMSSEERIALGTLGYQRVMSHFTMDAIRQRFETLYRQLV